MNKLTLCGAIAALSVALPGAALAQRNAAPAQILIVDTERVFRECTACRAANTQLEQQVQQLRQRAQQLQQPLQTEGQAIETALRALNGRQPDAALQQRITTFQQREAAAQQELGPREQVLRSTNAHIQQQIGSRLVPIIEQIRNTRGATAVLARSVALAHNPAVDVTNDVLSALNQQLPSVSVTPLPQQQQPTPPPTPGR